MSRLDKIIQKKKKESIGQGFLFNLFEWVLLAPIILLLLGIHFLGRFLSITRYAHVPTPCGRPESSEAKTNNYPAAVKSRSDQQITEESTFAVSKFFERASPSSGLEKVATYSCEVEGTLNLEFARDRIIACLTDGAVKLWNWRDGKESTINFGINLKDITSLQYDEEIVVLGTAAGTVHLFDAKKLEEKWSLRFVDPVDSLKFSESTLIILTRAAAWNKFWWVEISRSDMKLLNRRLRLQLLISPCSRLTKWFFPNMQDSCSESVGFLVHSKYCYLYKDGVVTVRYAQSGDRINWDLRAFDCTLLTSNGMVSLQVTALIPTDTTLIAGCKKGTIVIWNTCELTHAYDRLPIKIMKGHSGAIRSLCTLNEHLLSVDQSGKLYMWSGYDLECKNIDAVPRVLAENFLNVSCLAGNERWFTSGSSENGIISIWALPDLWLRTG